MILQGVLKSLNDTYELALCIVRVINDNSGIFALYGDLGVGKTTLCRYMIHSMYGRNDINVLSPTFNVVYTYGCDGMIIYHYDLYRIKNVCELFNIGFEDSMNDVCLIEWPDVSVPILRKFDHIKIYLSRDVISGHLQYEICEYKRG